MLKIIWMATILFNPALVMSDIGSKINAANIHIRIFFLKEMYILLLPPSKLYQQIIMWKGYFSTDL